MGFVECPECGSSISSRATMCPRCGYTSEDSSAPIALPGEYRRNQFNQRIEPWEAQDTSISLPQADQVAFLDFLVERGGVVKAFPALMESIKRIIGQETQYVAKLTPQLRKMLADGTLRFQYDKNGELMAILRDGKTQIFKKQLRLEEVAGDAAAAQAVNNLTMVSMLNQVLDEVREVREAIEGLHIEMQADRIALAEAAWDKLSQAQVIQDPRLRESAILNAISGATDAKHRLMSNFSLLLPKLRRDSEKSVVGLARDLLPGSEQAGRQRADDAMNDLIQIMRAAQIECVGWSMLGSIDASREALRSLRSFIIANELNNSDTLLLINEGAEESREEITFGLAETAKKIEGTMELKSLPIANEKILSIEGSLDV